MDPLKKKKSILLNNRLDPMENGSWGRKIVYINRKVSTQVSLRGCIKLPLHTTWTETLGKGRPDEELQHYFFLQKIKLTNQTSK